MATRTKKNSKLKSSRARNRRTAIKRKSELNFQSLEPRQLLAAVVVGNTADLVNTDVSSITSLISNDGGDGFSLRDTTIDSTNTASSDTIKELSPLADKGVPTQTPLLLLNGPKAEVGSSGEALAGLADQVDDGRISREIIDLSLAEVNSRESVLLGDTNQDGVVNPSDISQFISQLASGNFQTEADVNQDGEVNFGDILQFRSLLLSTGDSAPSTSSLAEPESSRVVFVTPEPVVVEPKFSATVSKVSSAEPELTAALAPTVEVPVETVATQIKSSELETVAVRQTVATIKPLPDVALNLVVDSNVLPTVDSTIAGITPADIYVGPAQFTPVKYQFLGARGLGSGSAEVNESLVTHRSLKGSVERLSAKGLAEKPISTAAELFDSHPESLDNVFDFEIEEMIIMLAATIE